MKLVCIECPVGCEMDVGVENGQAVAVKGNRCPRGKAYAEKEVVCPMRWLTTTVRSENGEMIPVKTDREIKKSELFTAMERCKGLRVRTPVKIGDILYEKIAGDANLIASGNSKE